MRARSSGLLQGWEEFIEEAAMELIMAANRDISHNIHFVGQHREPASLPHWGLHLSSVLKV
jgi:hypothetical protein